MLVENVVQRRAKPRQPPAQVERGDFERQHRIVDWNRGRGTDGRLGDTRIGGWRGHGRYVGAARRNRKTSFPGRAAAFFTLLRRAGSSRTLSFVRPRLCSAPLRKSYALRCVRGTSAAQGTRTHALSKHQAK